MATLFQYPNGWAVEFRPVHSFDIDPPVQTHALLFCIDDPKNAEWIKMPYRGEHVARDHIAEWLIEPLLHAVMSLPKPPALPNTKRVRSPYHRGSVRAQSVRRQSRRDARKARARGARTD